MTHPTRQLAVITGASRGIGLELARVFAINNFDLVINADSDRLTEAAADLKNYGGEVTSIMADLATKEGVDELYERINFLGRPVDVLVVNAGVGVGGEFVTNDFGDEFNLMNLNNVYAVYLTKIILRDMVDRDEGKILFTSSIAAEMPGPYYACYAASKAFIQSFSEALHWEMEDTGKNITVTALQPGPTDTNFFSRAGMEDTKAGKGKKDDPAKVAQDGFDALMKGKDHVVAQGSSAKPESSKH